MQIVIDISKETYNEVCWRGLQLCPRSNKELVSAIKNGTPLPDGHGRLIDVNRKITVSTYDEQYEEWGERTLTILEALNKWSDEGVTVKDIIVPANKESEDDE